MHLRSRRTDVDLPYFAGLIDGEGSIGIFAGVFTIEVKMTDKNLITQLSKKFGGCVLRRKAQKVGWKDQWRWRVTRRNARNAYQQLEPFLRLKGI